MNTRTQDTESQKTNAPLALTRELHEYLLAALVAKFGDEVRVKQSSDPENGGVTYSFTIHGAICSAEVAPNTDASAVLGFVGWLGRVHRGYARALRWVGENRTYNTVALAHSHAAAQLRDLVIASNRNTLSGDSAGIRVELDDFCDEVHRVTAGLRYWFPQFYDAEDLTRFRSDAGEDEGVAFAIKSPRAALAAIEESEEAMKNNAILYCYLTRWLGEWERNLRMLDSEPMRVLAAADPGWQAVIPGARLRALRALGRYAEVLNDVLPTISEAEMTAVEKASIQAECLFELGQPEDALETLQNAEFDGAPWVHFIRTCACVKLGRRDEAAAHFGIYESMIGHDMLARKKLVSLVRESEAAQQE